MTSRFLILVLCWSACLWIVLGGAAVALDPAGVRASHRARTCASMETWKLPAFARSGARTVILGNSRVALGMDATLRAPLGASAPSFNLALPAATVPEVSRMATSLVNGRSADTIVLGLDYGMFLGRPDQGRALTGERDVLGASAEPVLPSRVEMRQVLNVACTPYEFDPATGTVWSRASNQIAFENALHLQLVDYARCGGGECDAGGYRPSLDALRTLVRLAVRSETRLVVFINPLPALHLEGIRLAGAAAHFEQWKRDLAGIIREDGDRLADPARDFAVFAAESWDSKPVSPEALQSGVGFLDVSHYTMGLGRIVQRHLVSAPGDALFGAPLHPETVESHLQRDRAARATWAATHPREIARLKQRVELLHKETRPGVSH